MNNQRPTVVITGGSGFIGAHFVDHFYNQLKWNVIVIDSPGRYQKLSHRLEKVRQRVTDFPVESRLCFVLHADLTKEIDSQLASKVSDFIDGGEAYFINCASDSAVNRSITNPRDCYETNTAIAMNVAEYWREEKGLYKKLVHISTDEVYAGAEDAPLSGFPEWSSINPPNPYAASKAAQEALFISYWHTYGLPVVIANTMNNIGEWQNEEKFVPQIVKRLLAKEPINVYVDSAGVVGSRIYLDTKDHALMMENILLGQFDPMSTLHKFNLAGETELTNEQMVEFIAKIINTEPDIRRTPTGIARPGYDKRYRLNSTFFNQMFPHFSYTPIEASLQRIIDDLTSVK